MNKIHLILLAFFVLENTLPPTVENTLPPTVEIANVRS